MSEGGRRDRSGHSKPNAPAHEHDDPNVAPRERGLFGASRMDGVRAERNEVAAGLRNRLAVMRKSDGKAAPTAIPEGGGAPLPGAVRARMEPRLGADLSSVRVHAGGESADAAKALGARAFTVGNDVHFGSGELAPGTKEGDKLLAHELTHVVQGQRSGIQRKPDEGKESSAAHGAHPGGDAAAGDASAHGAEAGGHEVSHPDEPAEKEADAKSEEVAGALHGEGKNDEQHGGGEGTEAAHGHEHDAAGGAHGDGKHGKDGKQDKKDDKKGGDKATGGGKAAGGSPNAAAGNAQHGAGGGGAQNAGSSGAAGAGGAGPGGASSSAGASATGGPGAASTGGPGGAQAGGAGGAAAPGPGGAQAGAAGGQAPGAGGAPTQKAAPIAAKFHGIGRKIFRATGTDTSKTKPPPPKSGAGDPGAKAAPTWADYVKTLPPAVQGVASAIADAQEQDAFKPLLESEKLTFCKLTSKPARLEFAALDAKLRAKVGVIVIAPEHQRVYESFTDVARTTWRDITPDERDDLLKGGGGDAKIKQLMIDPPSLDKWRQVRNVDALKAKPDLVKDLSIPGGETPERIVTALSDGGAGERLHRVLIDTAFAAEKTKSDFILKVWNDVKTIPGKKPLDAMWDNQAAFALKGKEAKGHPDLASLQMLKAIPTRSIGAYGQLAPDVLMKTLQLADKSNPAIPRKPDGSIDRRAAIDKATNDRKFQGEVVGPLYAQYSKSAGVQPADATYTIRGGASPAAYWMATPDGKVLLDKNKSGPEVAKILAVDEDPAYSTGFIIVELKDDVRRDWLAKLGMITRPTAIDALGFDQFKVHPDPTACVGVTSGGMPEVVVNGAQLAQTNIVRQP